ncbi:MAG: hypothetical protein Q9179_007381, partial [Wetmoreana sp. 5 TL-2023]
MATLTPSDILYQKEHISDDRSSDILGTVKTAISYDDYTILAAQVLVLGLCFDVGYAVHYGSGRHVLAGGVPNAVKWLQYAFEIIYGFAMTLIKLSILMFYCRLFPRESTSVRWRMTVYAFAVAIIAGGLAGTTTAEFQCRPIRYFWTRSGDGSCINMHVLFYIISALTVVTDAALLMLPLPIVWKLQLPKAKKIGVMGIFFLGG